MEPEFREPFDHQFSAPVEEHEGLCILARIIAKAIIKDTQRKKSLEIQQQILPTE